MRRKWWFVLAVFLQVAILFTMVGMRWSTVTYGTRVLLKTMPIDPWDLFRGDYVTLNYEISRLDLGVVTTDGKDFKRNETVFVTLEQDGKYWVARSVGHQRPANGDVAIKGRVVSLYNNQLSLTYGIESYYVPQHQGQQVEQNRTALDAEVAVDRWGNASLTRLFLNDREVTFK